MCSKVDNVLCYNDSDDVCRRMILCAMQSALSRVPGVVKATVGLATEEALVKYNPALVGPDTLVEAVEDIGFEAEKVSQPPQAPLKHNCVLVWDMD